VQELIAKVEQEGLTFPYVYYDTETSSGFSTKMGFTANPFCDDISEPDAHGYEKRVEWARLKQFAKI